MQFPEQGKPPVGIVFDCDMGNGIDDALALALLYGFDGKNEARVVSLSVSKPNLKSAAFCDAIVRIAPFFRDRVDELKTWDDIKLLSVAVDRLVLETVLRYVKGNQVQAAEVLGMSRTTLRAKMRSLGLAIEKQLLSDTGTPE